MTFKIMLEDEFKKTFKEVYIYSKKASYRYHRFSIPKGNGSGDRTIYHPSKELKKYHYFLIKNIFSQFPTSKYVFSYKKNTSIRDLAKVHKNNNFLLRIDFKDFFPSITAFNIIKLLQVGNDEKYFDYILTTDEMILIKMIVCRFNKLTIGAPTSPIISNVLLYDFDKKIAKFCKKKEIVYGRYADDLYFSTNMPNVLSEIKDHIISVLKKEQLYFDINNDKTIMTSKKRKRIIAGLFITSENKISIGKEKKDSIKKHIYNITKKNNLDSVAYVGGYLSYIKSVEPKFLKTLKRKYGEDNINKLMLQEYK